MTQAQSEDNKLFDEWMKDFDEHNDQPLISAPTDMSALAGCSVTDLDNYLATTNPEALSAGGKMLNSIMDKSPLFFSDDLTYRTQHTPERLYALLVLRQTLDNEIHAITRPKLATLVKLDLPMFGRKDNQQRNGTISTWDGYVYVRTASTFSKYCEIGMPTHRIAHDLNWLNEVLSGIESTTRFYTQIVMTDPVTDDKAETFLSRGWGYTSAKFLQFARA